MFCVLSIFNMYAEGKYGFRTIARLLTEKGYTSQAGKEINPASLKGILTNPKYKGYYHGRLTESNDYRQKKSVKLPVEERLLYKDDSIPAIVAEELWDKVNAMIAERTEKYNNKGNGTQHRFPYSAKIVCEEHGTYHYRKVWKDRKIPAESWCCKEYLAKGRVTCVTPHVYTKDLDAILEFIGSDLLSNKQKYIDSVDELIELYKTAAKGNADYTLGLAKTSNELEKTKKKQDKILELYSEGDLPRSSYLDMNARLEAAVKELEEKIGILKEEQQKADNSDKILIQAKDFFNSLSGIQTTPLEVAQSMLDSATVLKGSVKNEIKLCINMKYGKIFPAKILKTDILHGDTEVSPIVGSEKQSEELINHILKEFETDPIKIWESNIFGKSLHELVNEGLHNKLYRMPEDAQNKLRETLQKIVNEGSGGLICIIL